MPMVRWCARLRFRWFLFALGWACAATPVAADDFEVWLVDQSNSRASRTGGAGYIYEGADLNGARAVGH